MNTATSDGPSGIKHYCENYQCGFEMMSTEKQRLVYVILHFSVVPRAVSMSVQ